MLLLLPTELRNMIWKSVVKMGRQPNLCFNPAHDQSPLVNLRRTCRQIDWEISSVFFPSMVLEVGPYLESQKRALGWLRTISTRNRSAIQNIVLKARDRSWTLLYYWLLYTEDSGEQESVQIRKVKNWILLLKRVPQIRNLVIHYMKCKEDSQSYVEKDYSQFAVATESYEDFGTLLQGMPNLETLSFLEVRDMDEEILLASEYFRLKTLRIDISRWLDVVLPEQSHLCPSLRHLQIGKFQAHPLVPQLQIHPYRKMKPPPFESNFSSSPADPCPENSSSNSHTVQVQAICDWFEHYGELEEEVKYSPCILKNYPNLTYLGLECGSSSIPLDDFPASLEMVTLIFYQTVDFRQLTFRLRTLQKRCKLKSITIAVNYWTPRLKPPELMPLVLLSLLQEFAAKGISTRYLVRRVGRRAVLIPGDEEFEKRCVEEKSLTDDLNDYLKHSFL